MEIFRKNEQVILEITDFSRQGEGIGKVDGFTFFVKDTIPGDVIEAGIMKVKKTYGYARLLRVITPSADRVEAPCPVARPCGGCQLQAMDYAAQLRWKRDLVKNTLQRIGGLSVPVEAVVPADPPLRYRHKTIVPVQQDKNGKLIAGFYAGRTHNVIPCEDCLLGAEENGTIVREVLFWMEESAIPAYDGTIGRDGIRHLFLRRSHENSRTHLCLVTSWESVAHAEELRIRLEQCSALQGKISGVSYNIQKDPGNGILGKETGLLWGDLYVEEVLRSEAFGVEVAYRISPASFFQVHPSMAERIYETVLAFAEPLGKETVFDLYCGTGTISLFLARKAGQVIGVEVIPEAVRDAEENAARNGISNACFLTGRAEEVVPRLLQEEDLQADIVVVDPPRKGCDATLLETIREMAPMKIVYVSCDPATLARDLAILTEYGYAVKKVQPFDQFAMTTHVEAVVLLCPAEC